jgi:protein TonB
MQVITDNTPATSPKTAYENLNISDLTASLNVGSNTSDTMKKPYSKSVGDTDATPILQIEPQYPIDAARRGIEGWVKLSFSIDKTGSVTRVQIIDSSPPRVFDREAKRALKRWRYKAKFTNGTAVIQDNLQIQLDFSLDNQ